MIKQLPIDKICHDGSTQVRFHIDDQDVAVYQEEMREGAEFPPIIVFFNELADAKYHLADGFHRMFASMGLGRKEIACDIRKGTRLDALLYACGANSDHGYKRTNLDKRNAVEMLLAEWSMWSDGKIAEHCKVSDRFVATVRREVSPNGSEMRKVQRGGKTYEMSVENIGKKPLSKSVQQATDVGPTLASDPVEVEDSEQTPSEAFKFEAPTEHLQAARLHDVQPATKPLRTVYPEFYESSALKELLAVAGDVAMGGDCGTKACEKRRWKLRQALTAYQHAKNKAKKEACA